MFLKAQFWVRYCFIPIKTKCMFISSKEKLSIIPEEPNIVISENGIKRVNTYKCLGLGLDESLAWEYHISSTVSEVIDRGLRKG